MSYQNKRIELIDALRGFALTGILLLHCIEHFDFFWNADLNPKIFHSIDPVINNLLFFLFSGKAYSIFSLMFGFSFFIQMDNAAQKGQNFAWKFLWRLIILCIMGYLVSIVYDGQILTIYAIMGLPLILFYRINKKALIWIAALLLLQVPTIVNIISSYLNPGFELQRNFGQGLWGEAFQTYANGSFGDVARFNMWKGHVAVWSWTYYNGRYLQLFGLFLIGLSLGKARVFENLEKHMRSIKIIFVISILSFAVLFTLYKSLHMFNIPDPRRGLYSAIIKSYVDLAHTTFYITLIILIYQKLKGGKLFTWWGFYGRMSLTSYIMQPLIGVPLFYGYGFALYRYFGPTLSLLFGFVFLIFQLWFCKKWFTYYYYGPTEWLWRAITFFNFKLRFRKSIDR